MLSPVVVDLNRRRVIREQAEIRRKHRPKLAEQLGIPVRVIPAALEQVIVDEEVNPMRPAQRVRPGAVERNPAYLLRSGHRLNHRNLIRPSAFKLAQLQIVAVSA